MTQAEESALLMHPRADLRIQLLGGFLVTVNGVPLPQEIWRRKAAQLVKLLALAPGKRLHRDQLLEFLWPDAEPAAAANSFYQTLHLARRILTGAGAPAMHLLSLREERLSLAPSNPLWLDTDSFITAAGAARSSHDPTLSEAALALYTGELLPEDRYVEWTQHPRETLRRTYLDLLLHFAELLEAQVAYPAAIEKLRRLVADDPLHEEAQVALMRLYALTGQRQQALRQYHLLQKRLVDELGAEPLASTQQLYQSLAAGHLPSSEQGGLHKEQIAPNVLTSPADSNDTHARASAPPTHLPTQLTSFVGRERELAEFARLLERTHLLTLVGPGGCGKTRLAVELATRLQSAYLDGVWLIDLAPLVDPTMLVQLVSAALDIQQASGQPLLNALTAFLAPKRLLLLLDNCEHMIEACAHLAHTILLNCPDVKILATSREPLHIPGEITALVPSLTLPDLRSLPPVQELIQYEAIQLFLDRAQAAMPAFAVTADNAQAVAQVCSRLDGMPLAIELAATRVRILSLEEIAARLDNCFQVLQGGSRVALTRQQTLKAALDWSYDLLSEQEQVLFQRLAVFARNFSLEAVEAICSGDGVEVAASLELFTQLLDKSLVVVEPAPHSERYRLLETIRQYADEHLRRSGTQMRIRARHLDWYLALAEAAEPELRGPHQRERLIRLDLEHENLCAAMRWTQEHHLVESGLKLAGALWYFWYIRGYLSEGRAWLEGMLALPSTAEEEVAPAARARALLGVGTLAYGQGDYTHANHRLEESLMLRRQLHDDLGISSVLNMLAIVAQNQGQYQQAQQFHEESLTIKRALGDAYGIATSLLNLGNVLAYQQDPAGATPLFEESLTLFRKLGESDGVALALNNLGEMALLRGELHLAEMLFQESLTYFQALGNKGGMALVLQNQGRLARSQGDVEQAINLYGQSLELYQEAGDRSGIAVCLEGRARTALDVGQLERAARLYGAASALRTRLNMPIPPFERATYEKGVAALRSALNAAELQAAWASGEALAPEDAVAYARDTLANLSCQAENTEKTEAKKIRSK